MRTPKIEALHRAIKWYNDHYNINIKSLGLDQSPINSNARLAGFTDGDGNFSINLVDRKKKKRCNYYKKSTSFLSYRINTKLP